MSNGGIGILGDRINRDGHISQCAFSTKRKHFHRDGVARHLEDFCASSQDDDQCTGNGREDEFAGAHKNLQATQDWGTISVGSRLTETI
jgi:hypothetical protein